MKRRLLSITVDLALVAATLVGSLRLSTINDDWHEQIYNNMTEGKPVVGALAVDKALSLWGGRALAILAVASVGLGIVAIRRPGAAPRRVRWRPGRVAATIGLILSVALLVTEFVLFRFQLTSNNWDTYSPDYFWSINAVSGGTAILVAWLLMAVSGRWSAARGWRDRLGLGLGGFWLVVLAWLVASPLTWDPSL